MSALLNGSFRSPARALALLALATAFTARVAALEDARLSESYGNLPLHFEKNDGQTHDDVRFLSRGPGYGLYLTTREAVLVLVPTDQESRPRARDTHRTADASTRSTSAVVRLSLVGADPRPLVSGRDELPGKANHFIGEDPSDWHVDVPTYARVHYTGVYPGIDLVYYGNPRQLEYDFVVAPGADPKQIVLRFAGTERLEIDELGDLVLVAAGATVRQRQPLIYQEVDGVRRAVAGSYVLKGRDRVGFEVAAYDVGKPLVIDPVLLIDSTYLGGTGNDGAGAITVDSRGDAYVTGSTSSIDFPTTAGAFQPARAGAVDAFVAKLDAARGTLVYSTYVGGGQSAGGVDVVVDIAGNAYVTGWTSAADFPTTPGAFQRAFGGGPQGTFDVPSDAFVAKLDPSGSVLLYSTYLGGSDRDVAATIGLDAWGNAHVAGVTLSADFPVTPGAIQPSRVATMCGFPGGVVPCPDAFVAKLDPDGSALAYSTYLAGNGWDEAAGIAVDAVGSAYVTGRTSSSDFPTTGAAFQPTFGGMDDAFVVKLDPSGSSLVYATYLGAVDFPGLTRDRGNAIAVDFEGHAYVVGSTISQTFPTTPGAFQTEDGNRFACDGPEQCFTDAFVTKLDPTGSRLVYSTYLGGDSLDEAFGIELDSAGNAYVTGSTNAPDFPTTPDAFQPTRAGSGESFPPFYRSHDAFVTTLNAAGSALDYSTYLGGAGSDTGRGISVHRIGADVVQVYVTGFTASSDFPTTVAAFQPVFGGGGGDAFVAKFLSVRAPSLSPLLPGGAPAAPPLPATSPPLIPGGVPAP